MYQFDKTVYFVPIQGFLMQYGHLILALSSNRKTTLD